MNKNKKKIVLGSIIGVFIGILISVSYAFFTFSKTSLNSQLVAGDIYMQYKETNSINIPDMMPRNTYVDNENGYFEFQITGKNTYAEKDIIYDVVLSYGDNPTDPNRTIRIKDELLRFRLVKVVNNEEQEIFNNRSYTSINNTRIHKETIPAETNTEITTTYRIYAWISEETKIGNATDADYSLSDWNKVFASIKVNVTGDFNDKEIYMDPGYRTFLKKVDTKQSENPSCNYLLESDDSNNEKIKYIIGTYSGNSCAMDFNYVWYSGKLWRITSIYPDGTMKMITDKNITSIKYGENSIYYNKSTGDKSYIFQWLNEDFLDTLYNYQNIIVTDNSKYWNTNKLVLNNNGKYVYETDDSNIIPTNISPVGLLDGYEYYKIYNSNYVNYNYLNIHTRWFLLNRGNDYSMVEDSGSFYPTSSTGDYSCGVRPSVYLKSTNSFIEGDGTYNNPYRIKDDKEVGKENDLINSRLSGEYVKLDNDLFRIVSVENNTTKLLFQSTKDSGWMPTDHFGTGTSSSDMDYRLNHSFFDNLSYKEKLVPGTYYLGIDANSSSESSDKGNYKRSICNIDSLNNTVKNCLKTEPYTFNVGLLRYGEMFSRTLFSSSDESNFVWLITNSRSGRFYGVNARGMSLIRDYATNRPVYPTIHLNSGAKIVSGNGLENNPYIIN